MLCKEENMFNPESINNAETTETVNYTITGYGVGHIFLNHPKQKNN
jgi:hypothetical protein